MNRPWVAIQRNPTSGTGKRRGLLLELVGELKRRGIAPRMFTNREKMQARLSESVASLVAPYLDIVRGFNPQRDLTAYPGSPLIARARPF